VLVQILRGDDSFSKAKWAKAKAKKTGATFVSIQAEDKRAREDCSALFRTTSLFGSQYVVVLTGLDSAKEIQQWIPSLSEYHKIEEHTLLIDYSGSQKPQPLFSMGFIVREFFLPKPWKLDQWETRINEQSADMGLKLNRSQVHILLNRTGLDSWRIDQELKKLRLVRDKQGIVDLDTFQNLVYDSSFEGALEFTFFLMNGDREKMLLELREGILTRLSENQILYQVIKVSMILYQLSLDERKKPSYSYEEVAALSKQMKLPIPLIARLLGFRFRDENSQNLAYQYPANVLSGLLQLLWETDYRWKQEAAYPEMSLLILFDAFQKVRIK